MGLSQASVREGNAHTLMTPGRSRPQAGEGRQVHSRKVVFAAEKFT